ncbi:hypothetical protein [Parafrigoribacterium humi]|uniref:hypothetical protein n=1 Tax=Parafrigoribacterium humi TaxID=3144664 RepID=UPI0032EBD1BD
MTTLALALSRAEVDKLVGIDEVFLWDGSVNDNFKSLLRPDLSSLGPVAPLNADFVRIALTVYAADHSVLRRARGSSWNRRELDLTIPVSDPSVWSAHVAQLVAAVNFLTGDSWKFSFSKAEIAVSKVSMIGDTSKRVVLVSGGADSATGALVSAHGLTGDETHTLVSHSSSSVAGTPQRNVAIALDASYPGRAAAHHQVFLGRVRKRLDGTYFRNEPSSRSRSLLFLALGLAVASQSGNPLWIPENGFASLNPPLGPERIGVLSTRTTQPWFLEQVSLLLADVGAHGVIENPFQKMTKGEMFAEVAKILGPVEASTFLSATNSCSHTDQHHIKGVTSGTHCGVCFGCVVRKASFKASGVVDRTTYLSDESAKYAKYLEPKSILEATRDFVESGIDMPTVMAMPLPDGLGVREAFELCERGLNELGESLI